ncbi:hypothetical protein, partial [Flavobacterium xinjiangense]
MKKFIFCKMKSGQEYCNTFSWRLNTQFLKFFATNTSVKKLFFYATLLLLGFGFAPNSYGQDVGSSAVKANFGIDGDVYSGLFQFQPNPPVVPLIDGTGTDDWFLGASGLGVIDEAIPRSNPDSDLIPNPMTNTSFERRQSIFAPTAPFPYPVVPIAGYDPSNPATWTGRYLWLDAVYGRDTYVKGGNAETSYFAGSGDKNSDNPSTWSIGTSGSVPQKDDIIDVYAHLRGEGIRIPDPITDPPTGNPRPFTTLWAYAGASLVVTNGNKHVDFEFFRTALSTPADLSVPGATGPDGGRTVFTFNTDGSVAIPGTIIISVDYINGGNVPSIRVRVWMSQATFDAYTTKPNSPFNVDKSVAFEKGTDSGNYGYAAINPIGTGINMWGRVNDDFATFENSRTQAPPWNTWEGTTPTDVDMYTRYQFVEIGINLTAFGLDKRGDQSPCSNILGSLLVKTRSSGGGPNEGAFGSELKDFAGPYLFGNTGKQPVVTVTDKTACEILATGRALVDLTTGTTNTGGTIRYYLNSDFTGEITSPYSAAIGTTTIYARSESLTNPGCFGSTSFIVTVNANPTATAGPDEAKCQTAPSGPTSFTLAGSASNGTSAWSQVGQTGTAQATVATPGSPISTVSVAGIGTVTLRITTTSNATPSCGTAFDEVTLTVNANPTAAAGPDQAKCQTAPSGPTSFTLAGTASGGTSAWSQVGQTGSAQATIATPGSPTSTVSVAGIGTVTLRITTTSTTTPSCGTAFEEVTLTVNANPTAAAGPDEAKCQTAPSGPTSFTLAGSASNGTSAWSQV